MRVGSLFTGIGGIDLGLERAGMRVVWQVECEPFAVNVLERHWPHVHRRRDVRLATAGNLGPCDLIAGGFPCQDISSAHSKRNKRGLHGHKSGLWREMRRIVAECRPRWVIVENSPRWRSWVPEVRADLAHLGHASLPLVLSAGQVGADHPRSRGFVVAHADGDGESLRAVDAEVARLCTLAGAIPWPDPPARLGMVDGIPHRMDRLAALGNAVVPRVVEVIGRAIMSTEHP